MSMTSNKVVIIIHSYSYTLTATLPSIHPSIHSNYQSINNAHHAESEVRRSQFLPYPPYVTLQSPRITQTYSSCPSASNGFAMLTSVLTIANSRQISMGRSESCCMHQHGIVVMADMPTLFRPGVVTQELLLGTSDEQG